MSDLTAKAMRAAEWLEANDKTFRARHHFDGWDLNFRSGGRFALLRADRLLIAFCEDRGWQDQEQEANGVEWESKTIDSTMVGKLMVVARVEPDRSHTWSVWHNDDWDSKPLAEGTATTREEARRQAVEAARGMG